MFSAKTVRNIRSLTTIFLVVGLLLANGGWRLPTQLVGWAMMLGEYSQSQTLVQAFQKTFGGKNPCRLCHISRSTDLGPKFSETVSPLDSSLDSFYLEEPGFFKPPTLRILISHHLVMTPIWSPELALPPPRS